MREYREAEVHESETLRRQQTKCHSRPSTGPDARRLWLRPRAPVLPACSISSAPASFP